jgi:hypothetical protein
MFDEAVKALELYAQAQAWRARPPEFAQQVERQLLLCSERLVPLVRSSGVGALNTLSHAVRFASWAALKDHLQDGLRIGPHQLDPSWFDALSLTLPLLVDVDAEVPLTPAHVESIERLANTLSMLTDVAQVKILDAVMAPHYAARRWAKVRSRSLMKARAPLYRFEIDAVATSDGTATDPLPPSPASAPGRSPALQGRFVESDACSLLIEALDDAWQGYDNFSRARQRAARRWVEAVLVDQPGFLEAGYALASMQYDAGDARAIDTLDRYLRMANALIPRGFKGQIAWSDMSNRFFHRMLWLRLQMNHDVADLPAAVRLARRQLRLNPPDDLGLRYLLPLMLLEKGSVVMARRETARLRGESDMLAAVIRAWCHGATGNKAGLRKELLVGLFSLPWLRTFVFANQPLPPGDSGFRGMTPDVDTFAEFAAPAVDQVPGLLQACRQVLNEPMVHVAEAELLALWLQARRASGSDQATLTQAWTERCAAWVKRLVPGGRPAGKRTN